MGLLTDIFPHLSGLASVPWSRQK